MIANERSQWMTAEIPELAIIDPKLGRQAAQVRRRPSDLPCDDSTGTLILRTEFSPPK